jgi:hypothetical protein
MAQLAPRTVFLWQCDGCGKTREAENGKAPKGFHGDATNLMSGDMNLETVPEEKFKSWYACTPRCIGPAIRKLFDIPERNREKADQAPPR